MKRLVDEPNYRACLRAAAPEQASRFSWARSAATLVELYHSVFQRS